MSELSRRDALGIMAAFPLAFAVDAGPEALQRASRAARQATVDRMASGRSYQPRFFTDHEWGTVRMLADYILPADDRSGSATEAGVPEFIDFMMMDRPGNQPRMRDGLVWLDDEAVRRWGEDFVSGTDAERRRLLDAIAWPGQADDAVRDGVRFFNMFRDLTASGFWSSEMGVADLQYIGNVFVPEWTGCPPPALRKLGVSYEADWEG